MKFFNFLSIFIQILLTGTCFFSFSFAKAQEFKLDLHFTDLEKSQESVVLIAVYNKASDFPGDTFYKGFEAKTTGKSEFTYSITLPEGSYALAFFQDLNGNKKLDKNFIGYPTEPFAFSNNAPVNFGPPKWESALFHLNKPISMNISF